ncbi:AGC family protein kinase [Histomonas meleagridis]|uniref:AGC family protein kinase n=1 Tax=Histomonas meleagridis TaxID=135588 RepID=UPI00355AB04E|nr:AGC family protein kinase [Histomonas meleagridis]KAH0798879.1 AGC family protein kinase [Histomonas meleagridis]
MEKYKAIKEIGKGGFGRAILVRSITTHEYRVVKELDLTGLSPSAKKASLKEAAILKTLKHTNIIRYRNCVHRKDKILILMDYADGGDLSTYLRNRKGVFIGEEQILDYFVQICLALKYIHDRKILHRDLKPQNVFLSRGNIIKLGDFGISTTLDHTEDMAKTTIGTPTYCSPEICIGKRYNSKSDIWSLGCILYEMITLRKAFTGANITDLMKQIILKQPAPMPIHYSEDLKSVVRLLLSKDPRSRPTINEIFKIPLIRNKAIALLGKTLADIELGHEIFHGIKPGRTPYGAVSDVHLIIENEEEEFEGELANIYDDMKRMAENLRMVISNDNLIDVPEEVESLILGEFYFMGRKLRLGNVKRNDPLSFKVEAVRVFLEGLLGVDKMRDVYDASRDVENEGKMVKVLEMTRSDLYVFQLTIQLVAYERKMETMEVI